MDSLSWFVKFRNPFDAGSGALAWEPSFFTNELEFYILAMLTFLHARRHGGGYLWLWWTTVAHGLTVECVSYWAEPIDNFWHAQSTVMFFGAREPFHIMCLYPGYIYTAAIAAKRLGLDELPCACATALLVVLFDIPYDIMGIKLLWWTWHDTDANIRDRHYNVPWTSYYFHITFAFAFCWINNRAKRRFVGVSGLHSRAEINAFPAEQRRRANSFSARVKVLTLTGIFSMPFGILQFVPGYHIFKDVFGVHAEVTTMALGAVYCSVVFCGLLRAAPHDVRKEGEKKEKETKSGKGSWHYDECFLAMMLHFTHYIVLVIAMNPAKMQVYGLHQPMGSAPGSSDAYSCDQTRNLTYPYPLTPAFAKIVRQLSGGLIHQREDDAPFQDVTVWKRPYLCPGGEMMDEPVQSFDCAMSRAHPPQPGQQWYWLCGTGWENADGSTSSVEYRLVVIFVCLLGMNLYAIALCYPSTLYEQLLVKWSIPKYYFASPTQQDANATFVEKRNDADDKSNIMAIESSLSLSSKKVVELRAMLKRRGMRTVGRKAELIERLMQ